uniref:Eukaryotic translation initiation factor 4E n=1 Tax=Strombidium rassoulzadegani TaxID=1082188 RepID=A0A7S3CUR1_9SPIT|mmetsp:Transcript_988/g.1771  ORF Transcript_988/g.1771 Transcript_988/m.1771 type:complete len:141 (+) Transcript_988:183-605(+)|eukprot:CAMPEP_0168621406 /NCGR_PEP_ID=MMETSP0449_2-20121227/7674_1 /TAXON_ID=1082188 /ORGANISM="Strombidium rassoulzadegani, Strain ras09" /LENGTH=140 /DNA_ID=CAMNT_0008662517 /DNA_START=182 /DNA_END=601 /DNA_ORIENTATION=+
MPYGTHLNVFTKGIKPLWEDPSLKDGARFQVNLGKAYTSKYWEDLWLAMIGENLGEENLVAGIVLQLKPHQDKISVWITDSKKEEAVEKLRQQILEIIKMKDENLNYQIFYNNTNNAQKKVHKKTAKPELNEKGEINTKW